MLTNQCQKKDFIDFLVLTGSHDHTFKVFRLGKFGQKLFRQIHLYILRYFNLESISEKKSTCTHLAFFKAN